MRLRIATTVQQKLLTMFYTYILRSIEHPEQRYIGHTADLLERLKKHNKGDVPHTAKLSKRPRFDLIKGAFSAVTLQVASANYPLQLFANGIFVIF